MIGIRTLVAAGVIGCMGLSASVSDGALSKAQGGSGYSGTLSSNKAIRKQQLICDPDSPTGGSTSVTYNPSMVTFDSLSFGPGYGGEAFIEYEDDGLHFVPLVAWLDGRPGTETGYIQVLFNEPVIPSAAPTALHGQIPVLSGYTTVDQGGPAAVDTHAFTFTYLPGVGDSRVAEYTVSAELGNSIRQNSDDFLEGIDDEGKPFRLGPADIAPVTVRGSLNAVPLPPAVLAGGVVLAGMAAVGGFVGLGRRGEVR